MKFGFLGCKKAGSLCTFSHSDKTSFSSYRSRSRSINSSHSSYNNTWQNKFKCVSSEMCKDFVNQLAHQIYFFMQRCMKKKKAHLLSLHDLCQPVGIIFRRKRGKVHFLLLQGLIIQPQSKYTKQPVNTSRMSMKIFLNCTQG